jgi:hypothetical protein
VADLSREELQRLARLGARARLEELRSEEAAIRRAFPDMFRTGASPSGATDETVAASPRRRRRSRMSAAARKAVSERMKKYWAEQRRNA